MIDIDGSYGEGGGQIVRNAIALSAVTGKATSIKNIRKDRPNPGLSAQHVKAIGIAALLCDAKVEGIKIGSTNIAFFPQEIRGGKYTIDIGTAGSIALLLQCIMPIATYSNTNIKLEIKGGTDVSWAPSIDYLKNVTLSALSKMGYRCNIDILKRGYYPRGGGIVNAIIEPSHLVPDRFSEERGTIRGISHCSNLPEHVAQRQADKAKAILENAGHECSIETCRTDFTSTGSGITLYCGMKGSFVPGKRGTTAEKVGNDAATSLLDELLTPSSVDIHLADQLIPYLGLAEGGSFTVKEISPHTKTNIWVTEKFLDVKFKIEKRNDIVKISIQ
ncbi:RNA 3'-terminal phosphate cyclase [Methanococcoides burtonii]|uniref:RNA 3'-terminal phosphate cyclase n=1 Tax=Methanococcoides burtonii (strain DSM 6242 / NBRC 107633 / OCM 468 / ACE-M) TaxID=259564 RepID=RTCA_METBU|nr:RNA 3'-terminal phosphate cyclase [Methanococcoides burtonii]Q12V70.1 RecName: Full=RNA 3'-terminal phosphate cyclase; Short=RNA cyclase; Short=RNA-3'-phosphate cyclase [Methanococcoides burtonii DSM 6242]ABE52656.1 RNA 3'-terminal phosphate cyclase [Methanococcoides burtonii DSM 6242]